MKISEKISQIRQQPEHIRLRYVWSAVAISMFFIIAIWIFSMGSLFRGGQDLLEQKNTPNITEQLRAIKEQAPSIKNLTEQTMNLGQEGVASKEAATDFQYPTTTGGETAPQTEAYKDLTTEAAVQ
jgi:heme exporter protein D